MEDDAIERSMKNIKSVVEVILYVVSKILEWEEGKGLSLTSGG